MNVLSLQDQIEPNAFLIIRTEDDQGRRPP